MTENHELQTVEHQSAEVATSGFYTTQTWELANRIAKAFAASSLVPSAYQGNVANCIVALEIAHRMKASPLLVMQNLYIVHGNPGWSAKFLIATFNQCGRFSSIRYEFSEDRKTCRAWAVEKATGERIEGPTVSVQMAQAEGWSTKNGSKWKSMPELMLMYRSAAFLVRTFAPELSMGLPTSDELEDQAPSKPQSMGTVERLDAVRAALSAPADAPVIVTEAAQGDPVAAEFAADYDDAERAA